MRAFKRPEPRNAPDRCKQAIGFADKGGKGFQVCGTSPCKGDEGESLTMGPAGGI